MNQPIAIIKCFSMGSRNIDKFIGIINCNSQIPKCLFSLFLNYPAIIRNSFFL